MSKSLLVLAVLGSLSWPAFGQAPLPQSPFGDSIRMAQDRRADSDSMTVKELYSIMNERDRATNQRFELQDKAVNAALAAAKEAVTAALVAAKEAVAKAEFAAEKRFDSVNEFRGQLRDQAGTLASKGELASAVANLEIRFKSLDEKIQIVVGQQTAAAAKSESYVLLWGIIIGGGGLAVAVVVAALTIARRKPTRAT